MNSRKKLQKKLKKGKKIKGITFKIYMILFYFRMRES